LFVFPPLVACSSGLAAGVWGRVAAIAYSKAVRFRKAMTKQRLHRSAIERLVTVGPLLLLWVVAVGGIVPVLGADRPESSVPAAEPETAASGFAQREDRYRVQPGDVIEFQFRFTPEFNQVVKVQPDGYVPLQEAGELKVGGLSVREAREATIKAYSEKLHDPVVSIVLKEFSMPYFIVGGEVGKPGRYDLKGDVMLSEAIQMAGGFGAGAHTSEILLFRRVSKEWVETKRINFKEALQNGLQEDIALKPGDSIFVSRSRLGKVQKFMEASRLGLFFNPLAVF
jgi:polysaccharide export outer membrane protein